MLNISPTLRLLFNCLTYICSAANPALYTVFSQKFRNRFFSILCFCRKPTPPTTGAAVVAFGSLTHGLPFIINNTIRNQCATGQTGSEQKKTDRENELDKKSKIYSNLRTKKRFSKRKRYRVVLSDSDKPVSSIWGDSGVSAEFSADSLKVFSDFEMSDSHDIGIAI